MRESCVQPDCVDIYKHAGKDRCRKPLLQMLSLMMRTVVMLLLMCVYPQLLYCSQLQLDCMATAGGVYSAFRLLEANASSNVCLFETNNRVGGR